MKPFAIFDSPLSPRMIIEASAGTGKTYTLVGIYLRCLLEKRVSVNEILVLTFTRLATKELKDRVLNLLRTALDAFQRNDAGEDPLLKELLKRFGSDEDAAERLRRAIQNFDEAAIHTIHGFCQQVLREEALLSGMDFDLEVTQEDRLMTEAAEDYWRTFVNDHSFTPERRYLITKVMQVGKNPAELLKQLMPVILHPEAEMENSSEKKSLLILESLIALKKQLADHWQKEREEIYRQLKECDVRRMSRYLPSRMEKMDAFLSTEIFEQDELEEMKYFLPEYFHAELKKNGKRLPEHPFFEDCARYHTTLQQAGDIISGFLKAAAEEICQRRTEKQQFSTYLTYDDLLQSLKRALSVPGSGDLLAEKLLGKYPIALVDEFQDTDPVQYDILDKIYSAKGRDAHALLMIGDPKQAIYAFRGADLYTYLKAREDVDDKDRYTLQTNYRSSSGLIEAINTLYEPVHQTPFLEDQISYFRIDTPERDPGFRLLRQGRTSPPLKVFSCDKIGSRKGQMNSFLYRHLTEQILQLIGEGRKGEATLPDENDSRRRRNLAARDIAVLVYSHQEAGEIKSFLKRAGIGAVTYSRENVFESREAGTIVHLMKAVMNPSDPQNIYQVLSTGLFGRKLSGLYDVRNNEKVRFELVNNLYELAERWERSGFYTMLRTLLFEMSGMDHLSQIQGSDRTITNLLQLAEFTAAAEQEHGYDPAGLLHWLQKKRRSGSRADEEETLRLESDENLVRIATIHNSKGLEFPVVFCPGLWNVTGNRRPWIERFHRKDYPFNLVVNLEKRGERRLDAEYQARFEEISEEVRKTYVAVTRAKYECRIFWTPYPNCSFSGLGALIHGRDRISELLDRKVYKTGKDRKQKDTSDEDVVQELKLLSAKHPDWICYEELEGLPEGVSYLESDGGHENLEPSIYEGPGVLQPRHQLHSFSSLIIPERESVTEPDYDQHLEEFVQHLSEVNEPDEPVDIHHFPRGAAAGTFIHHLFEAPALDFCDSRTFRPVVEEAVDHHRMEKKWIPVLTEMLHQVVGADYGDLKLSSVRPESMLKEMEFWFPSEAATAAQIRAVMNRSGKGREPVSDLTGYMTGFVDLIVRFEEQYYIIDYKSNYLGEETADYSPEILRHEMERSGYDIQYHLYTVALKKLLAQRAPLLDFHQAFGGVFYLFVRGMKKETPSGIFFDRPERTVVDQLEQLLTRT